MEPNGLPGGMFSGMGSGMLGLEMPLHQSQQPPPQNPQNPHHLHPQMVAFAHHEGDHQPQSVKHGYPYAPKAKQQQLALSDEDEPGFNPEDGNGDGKRKMYPWHRMKWTDNMVRLLIMAVYYIGDEVGSEGNEPAAKKKAGGLLQKKGKWKSVSKAMMEKGFYVSPQQCEDKFNDLNKRYKRVNDILGKGTACKVVENQSLLESMDHLSPKMKEEVRKLLNSKHLFFREMCAYHNSCGGGGGSGVAGGAHHSPDEPTQQMQQQVQQRCLHSAENTPGGPSLGRTETEGSKMTKGGSDEEEEDYEDDEDDDEDDNDEEEVVEGCARGQNEQRHEEDENDERVSRKRTRKEVVPRCPLVQQLSVELRNVLQDGTRCAWEKRQWMKTQMMRLEERQMSYQYEAFELEKQRLKWLKYCGKKEREMEQTKLKNERMKLENERMVLLLRQKELELIDLHQQQQSSNKRGDPSTI